MASTDNASLPEVSLINQEGRDNDGSYPRRTKGRIGSVASPQKNYTATCASETSSRYCPTALANR